MPTSKSSTSKVAVTSSAKQSTIKASTPKATAKKSMPSKTSAKKSTTAKSSSTKQNKTQKTDLSVDSYLSSIENDKRREECKVVASMMKSATGLEPKMWGTSMVGFGDIHYKYESGREGDTFVMGFSSRKKDLTLYGVKNSSTHDLLTKLGKYSEGKGCLYIRSLDDIDIKVLEQMMKNALKK
jgi:hypothetical protein